jgi:hypothetical protein
LPADLVGRRVSVRVAIPDGLADRIGLVLGVDALRLTLEHRTGTILTIERSGIQHARVVPTVPRGRNPRHAPADQLTALAHDPFLDAFPGPCWIARLGDLVDHLDDSGVRRLTPTRATRGDSRGLVNGEWSAVRLAAPADLVPLAAWAGRRDARNLVLTSGLPHDVLTGLGLERMPA